MKELRLYIFRLFFIAYAILTIASCNEKKKFDGYLYPIRENGLYGYIDSVGNRIIEPNFLWVSTFHDGLAMAVVDTIYREVADSMAYEVGMRDTILNLNRMFLKYGYINKSGQFTIPPQFIGYVNMPERGYFVKDMNDCIDAFYKFSFRNKRAIYCDTTTWKKGYIDTYGNVAIKAKYYYLEPFNEGLAVVRDAVAEPLYTNKVCITPSKLRCAYLDTLGNAVTEFKYESLTKFSSGRGIGTYKKVNREAVDISDTTIIWETFSIPQFLINRDGKEIKELDFNYDYYGFSKYGISVCSDGFFYKNIFGKENISYTFIDIDGDFLKPLKGLTEYQLDSLGKCNDIIQVLPENAKISAATYFYDGFAGITPDCEHWFVIDKYLIIHGYGNESIFESFQPFNNGLAAVKRNGKWGFINKKIIEQIPCKYDSCGFVFPFLEEIYEYDIQGNINKVAYINRNDSLVWESKIPKRGEIINLYSLKEKKNWGKWIYTYHPISDYLLYIIIFVSVVLLLLIVLIWRARAKKASKSTNTEKLEKQIEDVNEITSNSLPNEYLEEFLSYPTIGQYTDVIKQAAVSPDEYFDKLKHLRPVLDDNGEPIMSSGNFAVVFKMKDEYGKQYAVRCFHRAQQGREKNYKLICEELAKVSSPYLSPIKYYDKEMFVKSGEYPVLLMDWVEGMTLDKYIRQVIDDRRALNLLAKNFRNLALWLLSQPFAHGDLKPDNILVIKDGSLVLIDYDGMFVPAMQGQKAREIGSPDFRNPSRTDNDFDKSIDNFPIVSILLSLELIAAKSEYLEKFGKEDRLLFSHDDYLNLRESSIFKRALTSYADDIPELAILLERMVNEEPCNIDTVKKILLTNNWHEQLHPNWEIERKSSWFVGGCFFLVLLLPLYLRSVICWHIVMLYVTILFLITLMFFILVFVDRLRPNKKEHISTIGNEGPAGFFWWINFIPLLLMADSFTNWFNEKLPFLSQPFYKGEWYLTVLMWVVWWYSGTAIISIPDYLLKWRLKHFKTQEEVIAEQVEQELSRIRAEVEKKDKLLEEQKIINSSVYNDDLPF